MIVKVSSLHQTISVSFYFTNIIKYLNLYTEKAKNLANGTETANEDGNINKI